MDDYAPLFWKEEDYELEGVVDPKDLYQELYEREDQRIFEEVMKTLTQREQDVLYYRFWEELTLEQTGEKFNLSRERIRQIQFKAIRKLKHPARSTNLVDISGF